MECHGPQGDKINSCFSPLLNTEVTGIEDMLRQQEERNGITGQSFYFHLERNCREIRLPRDYMFKVCTARLLRQKKNSVY